MRIQEFNERQLQILKQLVEGYLDVLTDDATAEQDEQEYDNIVLEMSELTSIDNRLDIALTIKQNRKEA